MGLVLLDELYFRQSEEGSPRSFDIVGMLNRQWHTGLFAHYSVNVNLKEAMNSVFSTEQNIISG